MTLDFRLVDIRAPRVDYPGMRCPIHGPVEYVGQCCDPHDLMTDDETRACGCGEHAPDRLGADGGEAGGDPDPIAASGSRTPTHDAECPCRDCVAADNAEADKFTAYMDGRV